ncbi:MAG TPA: hypothetical protein VFR28_11075 [Allosphingosinicella sp.]|jgi:hypothetical protein|nr:hypothetical protein [Allosphingosinicella sp.]
MSRTAFAALSLLLLAGCGGREQGSTVNEAGASGTNLAQDSADPSPDPSSEPSNQSTGPVEEAVSPPDAVSHPNGYLPPPPAEPEAGNANSSDSADPPPATEDQYIRNGQGGR